MGGLGGFNPFPMQLGGAADTDLEAIQNAYADAMGTAIASERGTVAWVENHATARVLWSLYGMAQRMANQWNPAKMTDFLPRWEKILGLSPTPGQSLHDRRDAVAAKFEFIGAGTQVSTLNDYLVRTIGDIFVKLEFTDPMDATTYIPGGGFVPGGPTFLDGNLIGPEMSPFASSVGHVAIVISKPQEMSTNEFYTKAASLYESANNLIGAWMRFDWVNDGQNGPGFYLDEDANLDNQRFD